jgi:hypothetical protein
MVGRLHPLPGRLFRHGAHFDFMLAFPEDVPTSDEWQVFSALIHEEVAASRTLEKLVYENRRAGRDRFGVLHRKLVLG